MTKSALRAIGIMALLNLAMAAVFAVALARTFFTDIEVRSRFTQLDREGVINPSALEGFDPSYGFRVSDLEYRNTVPRYIAEPALRAQSRNAMVAGACTLANSLVLGGVYILSKRRRNSPERSGSAHTGGRGIAGS